MKLQAKGPVSFLLVVVNLFFELVAVIVDKDVLEKREYFPVVFFFFSCVVMVVLFYLLFFRGRTFEPEREPRAEVNVGMK